ncbi:phage holin [Escherichia coli]|uniref:phage holin n=1 Tax=Escherichia coli TaxID=562 RepID=UPI002023A046|nr:phage holin [Escherichia coli]
MEKITTGVSYTTSAVGTGYWLLQLLDKVSPSQWVAIGVLGSLLFGLLTSDAEPHQAEVLIVHFVPAALAQAS